MLDVDTEVTPPEPAEDEDDDISSTRITVSIMDLGDTHYDAAVQLFDTSADDPEKGAEALLAAAFAAARMRGSDHYWALVQLIRNHDGGTHG